MPEWSQITPGLAYVSPWDVVNSIGILLRMLDTGAPSSTAWPSANRALFIPFRVKDKFKISQAVVGCGATGGGNFDVGVYDHQGNRLTSSGSTARSASSEVVAGLTDYTAHTGTYYMALASDSTGTFMAWAPAQTAAVGLTKLLGIKEMASAFPLPSTATFATVSNAYVPSFALYRTAV